MKIIRSVYKKILNTVGNAPIESGGIIGMKNNTVCAFVFDAEGHGYDRYAPSLNTLNKVIEEWFKNDIIFAGIVHSHHNGLNILSKGDREYAKSILDGSPQINSLIFPIVTKKCGKAEITFYRYTKKWKKIKPKIV